MPYPGEGVNMANYGAQDWSPQEVADHWIQCIRHNTAIHDNHLAIKGDATSSQWPGEHAHTEEELSKPLSYYDKVKDVKECNLGLHHHVFHIEHGYNSKLHRDDRQHTVGLDIHAEEIRRKVPVRSSSVYGRHVGNPLETTDRTYVRIDKVDKGFTRRRGTGIPSSTK